MTHQSVIGRKNSGVGTIEFSHEKANSLPSNALESLAALIEEYSADDDIKVIFIKSSGSKAFSAGASFDELLSLKNEVEAERYFYGFGKVILRIRSAPKFVVTRVQGKAVGGAVGLIAAADYSVASHAASFRLSELSLGLAPLVISLPLLRKIGVAAFSKLSIDGSWHTPEWGEQVGLFSKTVQTESELNQEIGSLLNTITAMPLSAIKAFRPVLWSGTEDWEMKLKERATTVGKLALQPEARGLIRKT